MTTTKSPRQTRLIGLTRTKPISPDSATRTTKPICFYNENGEPVVLPAGTRVRFDSTEVGARTYIQTTDRLYAFVNLSVICPS